MPQQVDYAALAEQARKATPAPVDYAALAAQARDSEAPSKLGWYQGIATTLTDLATGAAKKLGEEGIRLGAVVRDKVPAVNALDRLMTPIEVDTRPTNTTQRVGGALEQVAEVIQPAKAISSTALKASEMLAPRLAAKIGARAASAVPRVAVEALGGAGLSAMQGGSALTGGALGAAVPIASEAVKAIPAHLRAQAEEQVMQALGPTKERFKAMAQRLTPEILRRGLRGSREQIQAQAADRASEVGQQIDDAIQTYGSRPVDTTPILDTLEKAKDAFRVKTDAPLRVAEDAPSFFVGKEGATPDQIWFKVLADARKNGYKGGVGELRAAFLDRLESAKTLQSDMAQSQAEYGPEAFLKAIRQNGGLKPFSKDINGKEIRGDYASIVESFGAKSTWSQKGGGSIFRNGGKTIDDMVTALKHDPKWAHAVEDENGLLDTLDDIARQGPTKDSGRDLEHYLIGGAGVAPGSKWWESQGPRVVEIEPRALRQLDKLQAVIKGLGPDARVDQLVAVRRAWDRVVADVGGYAHRAPGGIGQPLKDISEASAKREGAKAIRALLDEEVPELSSINKEYHFWKSLDDVTSQTLKRTAPHGQSLTSTTKEAAGQVAGAAMHGGLTGAFALGKVAKMANAVFTSPRWKLASAQMKDALAQAIVENDVSKVASVLARVSAVQGSKVPGAVYP
jgi:hypothetical protein